MRLPVDGTLASVTDRYYQFGQAPYTFQVYNPDGSVFPHNSAGQLRHHGMDIEVAFRGKVYAAEAGTVLFSGAAGTAGNMVKLRGKTGITRYLHLDGTAVKGGANVKEGQIIGYGGKTGYSNNIVHLHFDLERGGKYVDPKPYIKEDDDVAELLMTEDRLRLYYKRIGKTVTRADINKYVGKYPVWKFLHYFHLTTVKRLNEIAAELKACQEA